jgi:hypothetical protein
VDGMSVMLMVDVASLCLVAASRLVNMLAIWSEFGIQYNLTWFRLTKSLTK